MKTQAVHCFIIRPGWVIAAALVALASGVGCNRQQSSAKPAAPPLGKAAESWQFWEAFNLSSVSGPGAELLVKPTWNGPLPAAEVLAVLGDISAGERARSRAIASLPVLHADPDLLSYATQMAQARADLATLLDGYREVAAEQESILSVPNLGVGLLFNLLNHRNDKEDGKVWRSLLDQVERTTKDLQKLKPKVEALTKQFESLRTTATKLTGEELAVRTKLAQRFQREFPPRATYAAKVATQPGDFRLTDQQVMATLVGKDVGEVFKSLVIHSVNDFVSFRVTGITNWSEVATDYHAQARVRTVLSFGEHDVKLKLTYGKFYTRWYLVGVERLPGEPTKR